jgi:hypothetical protein
MPRGRAGGVPGDGLSRERKLRLDFGVPPREMENLGASPEEKVGVEVSHGKGVDVVVLWERGGVVKTRVSGMAPGILWTKAGVSIGDSESGVPSSIILSVASVVAVDVPGVGMSRPVAAANLICIDSGTVPALTHGRIVNVDFGRSAEKRSASKTDKKARNRWKMVS